MVDYRVVIFRKIENLKQSKEGKILISNFAYLTLLQIAGYIFPLITMPYLARVIGPIGFGKIAFASAIMVWVQTVADWGFNYSGTRSIAQNKNDLNKVSEIFSTVLWSRCILVFISFIFLCVLILFIPQFKENQDVILVSFLMVPGHVLFPDWFFQGMEKMKYITILNIVSKVFFTIAVFLFIKEEKDYILQPLFVSLGFILSGIIALYYIIKNWGIKIHYPDISKSILYIKNSTDIFINNLMPNFYNSFSIILLGMFDGSKSNGIYEAGKRFITILSSLLLIISRVMFPFLVRRQEAHFLYAKITLSIAFVSSLILFFSAPLVINVFFGHNFNESILVLRITSFSLFFIMMSSVYGTNYLIIKGYDHILRNITFIVSIIGFVLAFPLIYIYSYIGAAFTFLISSILLGVTTAYWGIKIKKKNP